MVFFMFILFEFVGFFFICKLIIHNKFGNVWHYFFKYFISVHLSSFSDYTCTRAPNTALQPPRRFNYILSLMFMTLCLALDFPLQGLLSHSDICVLPSPVITNY